MNHFDYRLETYSFDDAGGADSWSKGTMGKGGQQINGILVGGRVHWDVLIKK